MLSIGIICLVIGFALVIVASVTHSSPPLLQLGWVAVALGFALILLSLILPLATVHTATSLLGLR